MACSEIEELLPAYALDALGADEAAQVEEHLESCQWCRAQLREHRVVAAALAMGAPQVEPSASLKGRLMRALGTQTAVAVPPVWRRLLSNRMIGTTAASVAVLLLATVVTLQVRQFGQTNELRRENDDLAAQMDAASRNEQRLLGAVESLRRQNEALSAQLLPPATGPSPAATLGTPTEGGLDVLLERQRVLSYMIASQAPSSVTLEGGSSGSAAHGVLTITGSGRTGILVAVGLEPLPAGQTYQVWLGKDGRVVSSAFLPVDDRGWAAILFHSREPIAEFSWIGVTAEPETGSRSPQGPQVLAAQINPG